MQDTHTVTNTEWVQSVKLATMKRKLPLLLNGDHILNKINYSSIQHEFLVRMTEIFNWATIYTYALAFISSDVIYLQIIES